MSKKAKWVPFTGPCQGMPLREHTRNNSQYKRFIGGIGRVKERRVISERRYERQIDKRENREEGGAGV